MVVVAARQPRHAAEDETALAEAAILRVVGAGSAAVDAALGAVLDFDVVASGGIGRAREAPQLRRIFRKTLDGSRRERRDLPVGRVNDQRGSVDRVTRHWKPEGVVRAADVGDGAGFLIAAVPVVAGAPRLDGALRQLFGREPLLPGE